MLVFISWSGPTGKAIADTLGEWLPKLAPGVEPWISARDITKGERWTNALLKALNSSKVGLFLITHESVNSKWMVYEFGFIDSNKERSLICPIIFGSDELVVEPYSMYQVMRFDKADLLWLAMEIARYSNPKAQFSKK
jgi:hypothetical protein